MGIILGIVNVLFIKKEEGLEDICDNDIGPLMYFACFIPCIFQPVQIVGNGCLSAETAK